MKHVRLLVYFIIGFLTISSLQANPKGLEKKGKTPAGFEKGKKKGWHNNYPPGWDKKSEKGKADWKNKVKECRKEIKKACKDKGMTDEEAEAVEGEGEEQEAAGETSDETAPAAE